MCVTNKNIFEKKSFIKSSEIGFEDESKPNMLKGKKKFIYCGVRLKWQFYCIYAKLIVREQEKSK